MKMTKLKLYAEIIILPADFFVTGYSTNQGGNTDITTLGGEIVGDKSSLTSKLSLDNSIPKDFELYQNFPNPFNPVTMIKFDIPRNELVRLSVYDVTGKEIEKLINTDLTPGEYSYQFNASNYSSGVYFYRLETGDFAETRKMVILK
jgi:Secretion system C-terminal sorting domain